MEPRPLHTVVLKEGIKEMLIQGKISQVSAIPEAKVCLHVPGFVDMETFRRRKRWYKTRGVPYRRGSV